MENRRKNEQETNRGEGLLSAGLSLKPRGCGEMMMLMAGADADADADVGANAAVMVMSRKELRGG